ncbi:MAG: glycosyltransferase family 2 protein [Acidiferrobacterales bacterium]|nr:glycosyltransferase family 2 protein [Acidiferrobacterales bacterium]
MKFSTVIPLYNKEKSIRRAIYSVLNQQIANPEKHELIIVDDGSTDNSVKVVERIRQEQPSRTIILHQQSNQGVSAARNQGIQLASNEHITFLDADDSYEINFFMEIQVLINTFPTAQTYATAYRFVNTATGSQRVANLVGLNDEKHQLLNDFFQSAACGDLPITSSSVCINKSALNYVGGFPEGENMGEDQAVWSQLALSDDIAVSLEVCANYFEAYTGSLMETVAPKGEMPFSKRLRTQLKTGQVPSRFQKSIKAYISGHLLDLARRNLQAGDPICALELLLNPLAKHQFKRWAYWLARSSMVVCTNLVKSKYNGRLREPATSL